MKKGHLKDYVQQTITYQMAVKNNLRMVKISNIVFRV